MKKAQIWYTDFMMGILIFFIVIFVYYTYAHGLEENTDAKTSDIIMEAKAISNSLVTPGSPSYWNESNVTIIGITDGNQRIMQEKLDTFSNMDYSESKRKLRTSYEYYTYLEHVDGSKTIINGVEGNNSDDLIAITRIVVYNSELTSLVVHVWQ